MNTTTKHDQAYTHNLSIPVYKDEYYDIDHDDWFYYTDEQLHELQAMEDEDYE